jgi:hypothetical protein
MSNEKQLAKEIAEIIIDVYKKIDELQKLTVKINERNEMIERELAEMRGDKYEVQ